MWGILNWNPAFWRKVSAAAGGPECPKPHLIPLPSFALYWALSGLILTDIYRPVWCSHNTWETPGFPYWPRRPEHDGAFTYFAQTMRLLYYIWFNSVKGILSQFLRPSLTLGRIHSLCEVLPLRLQHFGLMPLYISSLSWVPPAFGLRVFRCYSKRTDLPKLGFLILNVFGSWILELGVCFGFQLKSHLFQQNTV